MANQINFAEQKLAEHPAPPTEQHPAPVARRYDHLERQRDEEYARNLTVFSGKRKREEAAPLNEVKLPRRWNSI